MGNYSVGNACIALHHCPAAAAGARCGAGLGEWPGAVEAPAGSWVFLLPLPSGAAVCSTWHRQS